MRLDEIARLRLRNQRITAGRLGSPAEVVGWLGAVQAQEISLAKWSLGLRSVGVAESDVDRALDSGGILRTHILRPTWHYVLPADIGWLMRLTAPRILARSGPRIRWLELDAATLALSAELIGRALEDGRALTRQEIAQVLVRGGVDPARQRLAYILMAAELDLLVASGPTRGGKQTYKRLPDSIAGEPFDRDAALAQLARCYFTSHGPATAADLTWWTYLTLPDVRRALELVAGELERLSVDGTDYWWAGDAGGTADSQVSPAVHLLQAFDEYIVGYRTPRTEINLAGRVRRGALPPLPFHSCVFIDGQVSGVWRRLNAGSGYRIEIRPLTVIDRDALESAVRAYVDFVEREVDLEIV